MGMLKISLKFKNPLNFYRHLKKTVFYMKMRLYLVNVKLRGFWPNLSTILTKIIKVLLKFGKGLLLHIQLMIPWLGLFMMPMSQYHTEIHFWQWPKITFLRLNSDMPLFFSTVRSSWKGFHSEQICELVNEKAVWDLIICIFIVWCLSLGRIQSE